MGQHLGEVELLSWYQPRSSGEMVWPAPHDLTSSHMPHPFLQQPSLGNRSFNTGALGTRAGGSEAILLSTVRGLPRLSPGDFESAAWSPLHQHVHVCLSQILSVANTDRIVFCLLSR